MNGVKVKHLTECCKPGAPCCKDENGNLITDPLGVLRLWRKQFSTLPRGDNDTYTTFRDVVPNPIDNDGMEILPPSHEEVKILMAYPLNCLRPDVMSY